MLTMPNTRLAVPLFVSKMDWGRLLAPTVVAVKVKPPGASVTAGAAGATPVPVNEAVEGLPAALLGMLTLAARVPVAAG